MGIFFFQFLGMIDNKIKNLLNRMGIRFSVKCYRLVGMEVSVNAEGNKATISIPALSYTDFDRTGLSKIDLIYS